MCYEIAVYTVQNGILYVQPQNSLPDVMVWLISKSNGKRVAYARVPAYDILYSERPDRMGRLCGQTTTLFLKVCLSISYFNLLI